MYGKNGISKPCPIGDTNEGIQWFVLASQHGIKRMDLQNTVRKFPHQTRFSLVDSSRFYPML